MKNTLAILMAVLLVVSMAACGASPEAGSSSSEASSSEPASAPESSQAESSSSESEAPAAFARGAWDGNVFTNEVTGVTLTVPEDWVISSDAELSTQYNIPVETLQDPEAVLQSAGIPDLTVKSPTGENNITVVYENTVLSNSQDKGHEEFAQVLIETFTSIESPKYELQENTAATVCGHEGTLLKFATTYEGVELDQAMFIFRAVEGWMGTLTLTTLGGSIDELLAMFA